MNENPSYNNESLSHNEQISSIENNETTSENNTYNGEHDTSDNDSLTESSQSKETESDKSDNSVASQNNQDDFNLDSLPPLSLLERLTEENESSSDDDDHIPDLINNKLFDENYKETKNEYIYYILFIALNILIGTYLSSQFRTYIMPPLLIYTIHMISTYVFPNLIENKIYLRILLSTAYFMFCNTLYSITFAYFLINMNNEILSNNNYLNKIKKLQNKIKRKLHITYDISIELFLKYLEHLYNLWHNIKVSDQQVINHIKLKNIPIEGKTSPLDFGMDNERSNFIAPIYLHNNLPVLKFKLGMNQYLILLDSGSLYNIINSKIIREFENNYFELDSFSHNVSLCAHNSTKISLEKDGKIVPLIIKNNLGKNFVIKVPFLVEQDDTANNILGYASIRNLQINLSGTQTEICLHKDLKPFGNYLTRRCEIGEMKSLEDGTIILEKEENCKTCSNINHPEFIQCTTAKGGLTSKRMRSSIKEMLEFDVFSINNINPSPFEPKVITIKNHNLYYGNKKLDTTELPALSKINYIKENKMDINTINNISVSKENNNFDEIYIYLVDNLGNCIICQDDCLCEGITFPKTSKPQFNGNKITIKLDNGKEAEKFSKSFNIIGPFLQKHGPSMVYIGHKQCLMNNTFSRKLPYLMELLFSLYPPKENEVNNIPTFFVGNKKINNINDLANDELDETNRINEDFLQDSVGLPDFVSEPASIVYSLDDRDYTEDLNSAMKNSHKGLFDFLKLLFENFDTVYSRSSTDLGELLSPNYVLNLQLRDPNAQLPQHKPFEASSYVKKATARILNEWEKSGIIQKSNITTHSMRLLIVKKKLQQTDFETTKEHLKKEHNIIIKTQDDIFRIDPDFLPIKIIQKAYRVVCDSRALNDLTVTTSPLQQSTQCTLFSLILNLGGGEDKFHPKRIKINSPRDIEKPVPTPNQDNPYHIDWEPPQPDPIKLQEIYDFLLKNKDKLSNNEPKLFYSCIDLKGAHNLIRCSNETSKLLNIVSPCFKFYTFKRSPFGNQRR